MSMATNDPSTKASANSPSDSDLGSKENSGLIGFDANLKSRELVFNEDWRKKVKTGFPQKNSHKSDRQLITRRTNKTAPTAPRCRGRFHFFLRPIKQLLLCCSLQAEML
jgi:hypothetical protein